MHHLHLYQRPSHPQIGRLHHHFCNVAVCSAFVLVDDDHGLPVSIKHPINICFMNCQGQSQARLSSNPSLSHWLTRVGSVCNLENESNGMGLDKTSSNICLTNLQDIRQVENAYLDPLISHFKFKYLNSSPKFRLCKMEI